MGLQGGATPLSCPRAENGRSKSPEKRAPPGKKYFRSLGKDLQVCFYTKATLQMSARVSLSIKSNVTLPLGEFVVAYASQPRVLSMSSLSKESKSCCSSWFGLDAVRTLCLYVSKQQSRYHYEMDYYKQYVIYTQITDCLIVTLNITWVTMNHHSQMHVTHIDVPDVSWLSICILQDGVTVCSAAL